MPSSNIDNCAGVSATVPLVACGQMNRPRSNLADSTQFAKLIHRLHRHNWVVYATPAFGGPLQVLRYLGRYTHRVAISNHRLLAFEQERVTFRWKNYAHGGKPGQMTLVATEFLRRFFLHVLPKGFVRWHCPRCGAAMIVMQRLTATELSTCTYFDSS